MGFHCGSQWLGPLRRNFFSRPFALFAVTFGCPLNARRHTEGRLDDLQQGTVSGYTSGDLPFNLMVAVVFIMGCLHEKPPPGPLWTFLVLIPKRLAMVSRGDLASRATCETTVSRAYFGVYSDGIGN